MRKRIGIILFISGILLYIQPAIDVDFIRMALKSYLQEYWPLILVFLGFNLMNKKKVRKRNR